MVLSSDLFDRDQRSCMNRRAFVVTDAIPMASQVLHRYTMSIVIPASQSAKTPGCQT